MSNGNKTMGVGRALLLVLAVFVAIGCYGVALGVYSFTLVRPWVPVTVGVAGGIFTAGALFRFVRFFSGRYSLVANFLSVFVLGAGLWSALFLGLNWAGASPAEGYGKAVVERCYTKMRRHTKRVGRRYVATGEPYKVFYVDLALPGHEAKPRQVSYSAYRRLEPGDSVPALVERGLFGMTVVRYNKQDF